MTNEFKNKVALVTGAGSGIGRASALAFSRAGTRVVVNDLIEASGEETVRDIERLGGEALYARADVSSARDVEAMITRIASLYGRLDYAHNNAGFMLRSVPIDQFTEEEWDTHVDVDLKGTWLCMKYEIPLMLKNGGGVIVNSSSIVGLVGWAGGGPYVASKHGVNGLTKSAALDYAKLGIRVNAVCPGGTLTPGLQNILDKYPHIRNTSNVDHPIGRLGKPEEIAEAVVWLCSDAASFVTGLCMAVDGGYTAL